MQWPADGQADEWRCRARAWGGSYGGWQSIAGGDGSATRDVIMGPANGIEFASR